MDPLGYEGLNNCHYYFGAIFAQGCANPSQYFKLQVLRCALRGLDNPLRIRILFRGGSLL